MTIERQTLIHDGPGGDFEVTVSRDAAAGPGRPGVLLLPNVLGPKAIDSDNADRLAALGYVAMVGDVFGAGNRPTRGDAEPARFMDALNADRALLRDRLHRSLAVLKAQAGVDAGRTAAIGYCFGGKCVLDLARSGAAMLGGVSFHGVYDRPDYAPVDRIAAKLLLCHGWEDPLAPPAAVSALAEELTERGADWQIHAYGHTGHAFTDPALGPRQERAFFYQPDADRRSWQAMTGFLAEIFA